MLRFLKQDDYDVAALARRPVVALEGIALVFVGAIVKWFFDLAADKTKKADAAADKLSLEERRLGEKLAEIDKESSIAITALTTGLEHIGREIHGLRGDMRDHRVAVFERLDKNEKEIQEIRSTVTSSAEAIKAIQNSCDLKTKP